MNKTSEIYLMRAFCCLIFLGMAPLLRAQSPTLGAKEVALLTEIEAPIMAEGKQIGSMKLKPGSLVTVVSSNQQQVMVRRGEGVPFPVPCSVVSPEALAAALATPTPMPPPRVVVQATPVPTPKATPTPTPSAPVFFDQLRPLLSDPYEGKSPRYTAVYFSAHWCGPCRAFTPKLVSWYKAFKRYHPDFELVFSSCDKDASAMEEYIKLTSMPWPVLAFEKKNTRLLSAYFPKGIPCLVFLDEHGNPVVPNPSNKYIPPEEVLRTMEHTVPSAP